MRLAMGKLSLPKPTFVPLEMIRGEENFDHVLSEALERNRPIMIDWLAAWCHKCIYLKPKIEKLAAKYYPNIKFYYVDVNIVPQALVKRAEVTLWKDNKRLVEVIGGHQAWLVLEEVLEMINLKRYYDQLVEQLGENSREAQDLIAMKCDILGSLRNAPQEIDDSDSRWKE